MGGFANAGGSVGYISAPTEYSGLVGWYDFTDITTLYQTTDTSTPVTTDGQFIGRVTDKSSAANHLTEATAANRATYKTGILNSLSVARCNGTRGRLSKSGVIFSTSHTLFWVSSYAAAAGTGKIFGIGNGTNNGAVYGNGSTYETMVTWNVATNWFGPLETGANLFIVHCAWYSTAGGGWMTHFGGLNFGPSGNAFPSPTVMTAATTNTFLHAYSDGSNIFNGDDAEFIAYNVVLDSWKRRTVCEYLARKYAL